MLGGRLCQQLEVVSVTNLTMPLIDNIYVSLDGAHLTYWNSLPQM